MNFIPYARQSIDETDIQAVADTLKDTVITRGEKVAEFENALAQYCGAKYSVAFNSGSSALSAAYHAAQTCAADRILTTPNSFVASVGPGIMCGATPVFVDIDRYTGNFDLNHVQEDLEEYLSSRGRTIVVPVHFAGIPVDVERVDRLICSPNTIVIEDAAAALGSEYPDGQKVGSCAWSQMTIFSFHPAKLITTGEGGMVMTNDSELYHRLIRYRDNGITRDQESSYKGHYQVHELTGNFHLTAFQAALGLSQLKRIDQLVVKRQQLMKAYRHLLSEIPHLKLLSSEFDQNAAYQLCVVQIDFSAYNTTRSQVMALLSERGIGTQVHYIPIYQHPFFTKAAGELNSYFPEMEAFYSQALTLPLYHDLKEEDMQRVVKTLQNILRDESQKRRHQRKRRRG